MKEYIIKTMTDKPVSELKAGETITAIMKTSGDMDELIRCKNCENHREPVNMCDIWHRHTNADGYCHRAKAKSKEQKAKSKGGEEG